MEIWVVTDFDYGKAIKAFYGDNAEEKASDYADEYYEKTGFDSRYDRVYLEKV